MTWTRPGVTGGSVAFSVGQAALVGLGRQIRLVGNLEPTLQRRGSIRAFERRSWSKIGCCCQPHQWFVLSPVCALTGPAAMLQVVAGWVPELSAQPLLESPGTPAPTAGYAARGDHYIDATLAK